MAGNQCKTIQKKELRLDESDQEPNQTEMHGSLDEKLFILPIKYCNFSRHL